MKTAFMAQLTARDREIRKAKVELASANARNVTMRENWLQVFADMEKEHAQALMEKDREINKMEERALNAERQRDDAKDRLLEKSRELYRVGAELEEERHIVWTRIRRRDNGFLPVCPVCRKNIRWRNPMGYTAPQCQDIYL